MRYLSKYLLSVCVLALLFCSQSTFATLDIFFCERPLTEKTLNFRYKISGTQDELRKFSVDIEGDQKLKFAYLLKSKKSKDSEVFNYLLVQFDDDSFRYFCFLYNSFSRELSSRAAEKAVTSACIKKYEKATTNFKETLSYKDISKIFAAHRTGVRARSPKEAEKMSLEQADVMCMEATKLKKDSETGDWKCDEEAQPFKTCALVTDKHSF